MFDANRFPYFLVLFCFYKFCIEASELASRMDHDIIHNMHCRIEMLERENLFLQRKVEVAEEKAKVAESRSKNVDQLKLNKTAVTNLNEHAREVIFTADRQYLAVKQDWVNNPSWYKSCLRDGANIPVEQWAAYRADAIDNCASALNAR